MFLSIMEVSWKYYQFLQMDKKSHPIKSNMPETDRNVGEQSIKHSKTLGTILRKKLKKKKKQVVYYEVLGTIEKYVKIRRNRTVLKS